MQPHLAEIKFDKGFDDDPFSTRLEEETRNSGIITKLANANTVLLQSMGVSIGRKSIQMF